MNKILRFSASWTYGKRSLEHCVLGQEPAEIYCIFDFVIRIRFKRFASMVIDVF